MELTAEEKRIRKDRVTAGEQGSSVLLVRSQLTLDDTVMVKVNTSGLTEKEVRGLMEIIRQFGGFSEECQSIKSNMQDLHSIVVHRCPSISW